MPRFAKVARMVPKIGTHNGAFHCDEALACFMLKMMNEYMDAQIVRTRDPEVLSTCDIVVDVGGVFDAEKKRFDHHQKEFCETMQTVVGLPFSTKLSSAGLVYAHYGKRIISSRVGLPLEDNKIGVLFSKVYEKFVEEIDAVDNGIAAFDGPPKYAVTSTLSSRVGNLNPWWNSKDKNEEAGFEKAMQLTGTEFQYKIDYFANCWLPARDKVKQAIDARFQVHESGEVLCFEEGGFPWKEHLHELEEEGNIDPLPKFVLYPESPGGKWRVQTIPVSSLEPFKNRLPLPESWRGLRNEDLDKMCGVDGSVFCHATGFIAGNNTKDGAFEMAQKALCQ